MKNTYAFYVLFKSGAWVEVAVPESVPSGRWHEQAIELARNIDRHKLAEVEDVVMASRKPDDSLDGMIGSYLEYRGFQCSG